MQDIILHSVLYLLYDGGGCCRLLWRMPKTVASFPMAPEFLRVRIFLGECRLYLQFNGKVEDLFLKANVQKIM